MNTIFYDDQCPFCQKWKVRIERLDKKHIFTFEPLEVKTDSMVLVEENGKKWLRMKAVLRIFWMLGWFIPGCFYILPSFLIDPIYIFIARRRFF
ncbi:MAG: DUF393 domain-containing protein [Chlamydiales bacterium]|nr:DUF393 domain-containing protein [Chlamydiales bacterium]